MISACAANTHRQTEEGILEPVFSVEGDGFWEAGERVAVELALSCGKQLHIVVENLASRAAGRPGRQAGMRCVCSSIATSTIDRMWRTYSLASVNSKSARIHYPHPV